MMLRKTNIFDLPTILWTLFLQVFVIFVFVSISIFASAQGLCLELFKTSSPPTYSGLPQGDSIAAVKIVPGQHGGDRYVVQLKSKNWDTKRLEEYVWLKHVPDFVWDWFESKRQRRDGLTPQGDPHRFIELYGEKVAKFFGFEHVSETEMIVPSLNEFNRAVDNFNRMSEAAGSEFRLPIKGFATASREPDLILVLQKFLYDGEVPVGNDRVFFHDLNFHLIVQLIHPKLLNLARSQIKAVLDLDQYLKKNHAALKLTPPFNNWFNLFVSLRTAHLDVGTGNSYSKFAKSKLTFMPNYENLVCGGFTRAINPAKVGLAPGNYIRRLAQQIVDFYPTRIPGAKKKFLEIIEKYLEQQSDEKYWQDLEINETEYEAFVAFGLSELNRIIP